MLPVVRWLLVLLALAATVLLITQISAQMSSTSVEVQLAVTARIDERDRLEFGVIPPAGATSARILPRARFLRLDQAQVASGWRSSTPVSVRVGTQSGDTVVVRIVARATGAETVEFGLQQMAADGAWAERILPSRRFFPLATVAGIWLRSRSTAVDVSSVDLSDCTLDQQIAHGRGCRYPGSTEVFAVDLQGRGTYRSESAANRLDVRFNIGTVFHELQAESERDVWRITGLGVLPLCHRDQIVTHGQTCDHPQTGDEFAVARDGSATFRGHTYQSGTIGLVDFEAVRSERATAWTMMRVAAYPHIEAISCSPSDPMVDEVVRCTAVSSTPLDAYDWAVSSGSPRRSSAAEFVTTFGRARDASIRLSATAVTGGDGVTAVFLRVYEPPTVGQITCTPSEPGIGVDVICEAQVSGLANRQSWFIDDVLVHSGSAKLTTSLDEPGQHQVRFVADSRRGPSDEGTVSVNARVTAVQISAGYGHTCVLDGVGHIDCWGVNWKGQTDFPGGRFKQISAGYQHTCAIDFNDQVQCWGDNQRSDRSYAGQSDPPTGRFRQVSAGGVHTCGIRFNDKVECWGTYFSGRIPSLEGSFEQIDSGNRNTCGITVDGDVQCDSAGGPSTTPPTGRFSQINQQELRACAILPDSSMFCWNLNDDRYPVTTPGASQRFRTVSVAAWHTCAITVDQEPFFDDGEAYCWQHSVLDINHNKGQTIPPDERFVEIASGTFHTCGIKTNGKVVCWGDGSYGQLDVPERFADLEAP